MMDTGQRWHVMEEMGGTTPWWADGSGRNCCIWQKTYKKTQRRQIKK